MKELDLRFQFINLIDSLSSISFHSFIRLHRYFNGYMLPRLCPMHSRTRLPLLQHLGRRHIGLLIPRQPIRRVLYLIKNAEFFPQTCFLKSEVVSYRQFMRLPLHFTWLDDCLLSSLIQSFLRRRSFFGNE